MKNLNCSDNGCDYREEFDPARTPNILADEIQACVDDIISKCRDVDWSEDLISYKIIEQLRYILARYKLPDIEDGLSGNKFNMEVYKLTGKAEQSHGDIAFIVNRFILGQEKPISGVAFYEAKASGNGYEQYRYPSFDIQQLRKLVTNTPKLSYLIYNREAQEIRMNDWLSDDIKKFHAITIDANFLKQCRNIHAASITVGQSFGIHFVKRVLSGRDLDYSRSIEETIRRWLKCTKRSAPLVISVSVQEKTYREFPAMIELSGFEKVTLPQLDFLKPKQLDNN
jgi:hypothetical protein